MNFHTVKRRYLIEFCGKRYLRAFAMDAVFSTQPRAKTRNIKHFNILFAAYVDKVFALERMKIC